MWSHFAYVCVCLRTEGGGLKNRENVRRPTYLKYGSLGSGSLFTKHPKPLLWFVPYSGSIRSFAHLQNTSVKQQFFAGGAPGRIKGKIIMAAVFVQKPSDLIIGKFRLPLPF